MSVILSADDLNDFISPGVACIKPVETLPSQNPNQDNAPYEVTREDQSAPTAAPASISLTDCLACSGCVTSAEAVLVSLQSHTEVLNALDTHHSLSIPLPPPLGDDETLPDADQGSGTDDWDDDGRIFVASISPQVRASLAVTDGRSEAEAGNMIDHLLSGPHGIASGGQKGTRFAWVVDTNAMREASLVLGADEVLSSLPCPKTSHSTGAQNPTPPDARKLPILSSACPGWICYAEKNQPHVLPHLSHLKSPQALTGTLLKTVLSRQYRIPPSKIWHLAIMPCFDKKLEASREELTDVYWHPDDRFSPLSGPPTRDVDCVITARELLMLADSRGISFPNLPRTPLRHPTHFPDPTLSAFLFPPGRRKNHPSEAGTSGGYLHHILSTVLASHPSSTLTTTRGRNADVIEYSIISPNNTSVFKASRYYGFHNIQNLVRKLKPPHLKASRMPGARSNAAAAATKDTSLKNDHAYVEVMACPGGCTNGGGQIKVEDVNQNMRGQGGGGGGGAGGAGQREWLGKVDEAYFSGSEADVDVGAEVDVEMGGMHESTAEGAKANDSDEGMTINGISHAHIHSILAHWSSLTGISLEKLVYTSYRMVESDVGKKKKVEKKGNEISTERVAQLAGRAGGGW